jgi:hypothetical protein
MSPRFKVLLSSLFSNILNLFSFTKVKDEVSHPYNRGKIIILAFYAHSQMEIAKIGLLAMPIQLAGYAYHNVSAACPLFSPHVRNQLVLNGFLCIQAVIFLMHGIHPSSLRPNTQFSKVNISVFRIL